MPWPQLIDGVRFIGATPTDESLQFIQKVLHLLHI